MRLPALALLAIYLAGCAGGREFVRREDEPLNLGSTTFSDIVRTYGDPLGTGVVTINGVALHRDTYTVVRAVPFTTSLRARTMEFLYHNGKLVGYDYASSFEDDRNATAHGDERVNQIAKGDQKAKVISILGKPGGEAIFPVAGEKGQSIFKYTLMNTHRIPFGAATRTSRKVLTITFDSNHTVIDVTRSESKPN